ncbi:ferredoxin--NADP+ reductase [Kribbella amoyensis]|uniref:ferredoxin--NADP(+) reductase n=1 Tax=Kribbella amoyensis TaxID=996641 RepID=A0A561B826_9ACTN|nr:FAD-dependent oxidoreductase [Kribbella amoyensis]TWD74959.1 ferredoxin--NADP+ reductase [Kribbella amoyensis]
MTYAITGDCCSDASCVSACPMNCIHPSPGEPGFGTTDGLFIDPRTCIDCGACAEVCPVDAAKPADQVTPAELAANAEYFADRPLLDGLDLDSWEPPRFDPWTGGPRRVAVVGAGPAGMYATRELLLRSTAEVTVYDRLPLVGGLARYGVAPDHPSTKRIVATFERVIAHPRVRWRPGVEVTELGTSYDAVVHAVGSYRSRLLGIPGEDGERSCTAAEVVAWYNGRPGGERLPVPLAGPRAVIVGNGNVALDLARLLVSDERRLAGIELPAAVRETLAESTIREIVLVGRRGPDAAAYTVSALRDLLGLEGVEVVVDADGRHDPLPESLRRERLDLATPPRPGRRVVLRFGTTPTAWDPAVGLATSSGVIEAGNLFTAIGFAGSPVHGLPFDEERGIVPNVGGAVLGRPGQYVTGWIKRGARGGIGANKACAEETVRTLLNASTGALAGGPEVSAALL